MFKIIKKDIILFFKEKKSTFLILIVSLIISTYCFCIFNSLNLHIATIKNNYDKSLNGYYIGEDKSGFLEKEKIEKSIQWLVEENIKFNIYSEISTLENNLDKVNNMKNSDIISYEDLIEYEMVIGSNHINKINADFIGADMTQKDLEDNSRYILIQDTSKIFNKEIVMLNKEYDIKNNTYVVKAINKINYNMEYVLKYCNKQKYYRIDHNTLEVGIIPATTFLTDNYKICRI